MGRTNEKYRQKIKNSFIELSRQFAEMEQFEYVYINNEKTHFIISNKGRLFTLDYNHTGKIRLMSTGLNRDCHVAIVLKHKGHNYAVRIHRLVAMAFVPNPFNKPCVHHIDGNPLNNNAENLMWVDVDEHVKLTLELEQYNHAKTIKNPKYTDKQIELLIKLISDNKFSLHEIADKTGLPYGYILYLRNHNTIRLTDEQREILRNFSNLKNKKYDTSVIHSVCKELEKFRSNGELTLYPEKCYKSISKKYGISIPMIKAIKLHKRHKNISKEYNF